MRALTSERRALCGLLGGLFLRQACVSSGLRRASGCEQVQGALRPPAGNCTVRWMLAAKHVLA